jgi:cell division protein YceG involved in septum cleavage
VFRRLIFLLLILLTITGIIAGYWLHDAKNRVITNESQIITVASGASMRGFADQMVSEGLLDEPWSLRVWARYQGLSGSLKAGDIH